MLRPATPLTVLLLAAFVLLLLSVISAPLVRSIPIARAGDVSYGVFGYCKDNEPCSGIEVGYSIDVLALYGGNPPNFNLPTSARHSLSALLIVHPIAAFMILVMLVLAVLAHWHGPSHSPRYLLALLVLTLPTLLISLLAFLVDILLFIPYVSWAGWLVLASTILVVASGITLCAMRRTLVSRKARRKRIEENAEMSGENFYNRQREQEAKMAAMPAPSTESRSPLVNGSNGADNLPVHASFAREHSGEDELRSDSLRGPVSPMNDDSRYYASPSFSGPTLNSPASNQAYSNSLPPDPRMFSEARGYPPNAFPRGRGGFSRGRGGPRGGYGPPPGRGAYRGPPPPQGYPARGGFAPNGYPARGRGGPIGGPVTPGPSVAMIQGTNRRPPPGYPSYGSDLPNSDHDMKFGPVAPVDYDTSQPHPNTYVAYNAPQQRSGSRGVSPYQEHRRSTDTDGLARAESPPPEIPIGHAIEMDATTGRPSTSPQNQNYQAVDPRSQAQNYQDVPPSSQARTSHEQYIPARTNWNSTGAQTAPSPRASSQQGRTRGSSIASNSSKYYEDVDPRFAENPEPPPALPQHNVTATSGPIRPPHLAPEHSGFGEPLPKSESFDELPPGAMSPTNLSETSHYTSVSQRPINPNWNGQPSEFSNLGPMRRPVPSQARQDIILSNNPDFSVPGMGPPRGMGRGRGGFRGAPARVPPSSLDLGGDSRYPDPTVMTQREI